jgi:hypothetical protein
MQPLIVNDSAFPFLPGLAVHLDGLSAALMT